MSQESAGAREPGMKRQARAVTTVRYQTDPREIGQINESRIVLWAW